MPALQIQVQKSAPKRGGKIAVGENEQGTKKRGDEGRAEGWDKMKSDELAIELNALAHESEPGAAKILTDAAEIVSAHDDMLAALREISRDAWSGDAARLRYIATTADEAIKKSGAK